MSPASFSATGTERAMTETYMLESGLTHLNAAVINFNYSCQPRCQNFYSRMKNNLNWWLILPITEWIAQPSQGPDCIHLLMAGNITQTKLDYPCPKAISMRVMLIFLSKTTGSVAINVDAAVLAHLTCSVNALDIDQREAEVTRDGKL